MSMRWVYIIDTIVITSLHLTEDLIQFLVFVVNSLRLVLKLTMGRTPKVSCERTAATIKKYEDQLIREDGKSKYLLEFKFDFVEFNTYI